MLRILSTTDIDKIGVSYSSIGTIAYLHYIHDLTCTRLIYGKWM